LRRDIAMVCHIGAMDDAGHQDQRAVGAQAVLLDQDLERAQPSR
jgi:hypothetical protein